MDDELEKASSDPRPGFMVSRDSALALSRKTVHVRGIVMTAMIEYFLYGEVRTKLNEVCQTLFDMIQPGMDRDKDNYEKKAMRNQENGKKGGRPRKETLNSDPETTPKTQKTQWVSEKPTKTHKQEQEHKQQQEQEQEQQHQHQQQQEQEQEESAVAVADEKMKNEKFLSTFFSPEKQAQVETLCMQLHSTPDELKRLAHDVVAEWELTEAKHESYQDQAQHLINQLRIKTIANRSPAKGSAKSAPPTAPSPQGPTWAEVTAQEEEREREIAEREKHAISYEKHLEIAALEAQGYACDDVGNILGVKKELEAQGWKFGPLGEIVSRPKEQR